MHTAFLSEYLFTVIVERLQGVALNENALIRWLYLEMQDPFFFQFLQDCFSWSHVHFFQGSLNLTIISALST